MSKWAVDFNVHVIAPLVHLKQKQKFFAKYFELRPYNYAMP